MTESFTLQEPPLETHRDPLAGAMLTVDAYAAARGVEPRSVRRYIQKGKLPTAVHEDGRWMIPADAEPILGGPAPAASGSTAVARTSNTPAAVAHRGRAQAEATLEDHLATETAFLSLDTAARLMGLDTAVVVRMREEFGTVRLGELDPKTRRRAWVVPQATVRRIAGL